MEKFCLNRDWRLHEAPLHWDRNALARVTALEEGWLPCELPCDIHMPLTEAGIIGDVVKADYCYGAEWTQNRSWWFVRTFEGNQIDREADVIELTFESLDSHADIFLNGEWLGRHISAHYPFVCSLYGKVLPGPNVLAVRVTTGLETVSDEDLSVLNWAVSTEAQNGRAERGDKRRAWLRRPQYSVGWDWGPKAPTCGIVRDAYITTFRRVALRGVHLAALEAREGFARLRLTAEVDLAELRRTRDADLCVCISMGSDVRRFEMKDVLLTSGLNYVDMDIELEGAKLWWPAGSGDQPLYDVDVSVNCEGVSAAWPRFRYGVRTVALDTRRTGSETRSFSLIVNGKALFCKGADWIPADSVYARVSREKYETLIREAREANFNMLRIWGGGIYEPDVFYEACDREGILIWHDFMFGCASAPDHLDWYRREVEAEMDYQTRRLRNHPCMALWCGNNENHWAYGPDRCPGMNYAKQYGLLTGNLLAKVAVRNNCPEIPYWNSSPYGGEDPNDRRIGDVHHWHECMMNPDMAKRIEPKEYDLVQARFVSEYGYPGPCRKESIADYFDGREIDRSSKVWDLHNNVFEKGTVVAGIEKHYLDNAAGLDLDRYILYAGLVQSLMLEYSLEAMRFKDFCGGGLFWMYNDTWGEVGWTIIDYYLRRKISFYGVKRAFAPVKLTLREVNGKAVLQGCNDTGEEVSLCLNIGYMPFDGSASRFLLEKVVLAPYSRAYLGEYDLPEADYTAGSFVAIPVDGECAPAVLRRMDTRMLKLPGGMPRMMEMRQVGDDVHCTLVSGVWLHGVHVAGNIDASDNYFDLLPGQVKKVVLYNCKVEDVRWKTEMDYRLE